MFIYCLPFPKAIKSISLGIFPSPDFWKALRQSNLGVLWGKVERKEKDGGLIFLGVLLERESGETGAWGKYIEEIWVFKSIVQKMKLF